MYMLGGGGGGMSELEMDQLGKKEHFYNINKNSDILEKKYASALIMLFYQKFFFNWNSNHGVKFRKFLYRYDFIDVSADDICLKCTELIKAFKTATAKHKVITEKDEYNVKFFLDFLMFFFM